MLKRKNQSGFTLLEVALVLIIASLIVLAVIKAQGIWNEAKSFRMIRQVQELQVAVALYENKIGELPGDTNGDGEIDNNNFADEWARELFDEDLVVSVAKATRHPFGGNLSLDWTLTANNPHGSDLNLFLLENVPIDFARALDDALDNGVGTSGSVQATAPPPADQGVAVTYASANSLVYVYIRLD